MTDLCLKCICSSMLFLFLFPGTHRQRDYSLSHSFVFFSLFRTGWVRFVNVQRHTTTQHSEEYPLLNGRLTYDFWPLLLIFLRRKQGLRELRSDVYSPMNITQEDTQPIAQKSTQHGSSELETMAKQSPHERSTFGNEQRIFYLGKQFRITCNHVSRQFKPVTMGSLHAWYKSHIIKQMRRKRKDNWKK